jgi:hypothetical protein
MPDPISSSFVPPDLTCSQDPRLSCEPPAPVAAADSPNASQAPEPRVVSSSSSAASELVSSCRRTDHAKLIEASAATMNGNTSERWFVSPQWTSHQKQIDLGSARATVHGTADGVHLTGSLDVVDAGVHFGRVNDDGSRGENVGAMATVVGAEATAEYHGYSFTFGASLSFGASVSSGDRDIDGDGVTDHCFKGSLGPLTFGECDEF